MLPPFVGVAVKVTLVPVQIVVADAIIFTVGVISGFTVIDMLLLVTDAGEAQDALLVIITFTLLPLVKVLVVKVLLLVPALTPFTCH